MKRNKLFILGLAFTLGLTACSGSVNNTLKANVLRENDQNVTLTKATSVAIGDRLILAAETDKVKQQLTGISSTSTPYGTVAAYTNVPDSSICLLTVEGGSTATSFALKMGENYLSWTSGNSLTTSSTLNSASSWNITFNNGTPTIANVGTAARLLQYNSSSPRFACYTSSQSPVTLWKLENTSSSDKCTVTFETYGGNYVAPKVVDKGSTIPAEEMPSTRKADDDETQLSFWFMGWYTTEEFVETNKFDHNFVINNDITVYAYYAETHYYIVHFDTNGGPELDDLHHSDSYTFDGINDPIWGGYTFLGWYTTKSCDDGTEYVYGTYLTQNITLYAKWEMVAAEENYYVGILNGGHGYRVTGEVTAKTKADYFTVQNGNNAVLIHSKDAFNQVQVGNTVDLFGYYVDSGNTQEIRDLTFCDIISDDTTISTAPITDPSILTEKFENINGVMEYKYWYRYFDVTVTLDEVFSNRSAKVQESDLYLYYNDASYVNVDSSFDSTSYKKNDIVSAQGVLIVYHSSGNTKVELNFTNIGKVETYTVTFDSNAENTTTVYPVQVVGGKTMNEPTEVPTRKSDENYSYTFAGWYVEESCETPFDFENTIISEDTTVYAKWNSTLRAAKDVVEEDLISRSYLAYNYSKEGEGATDRLTKENTVKSGTNYKDWTVVDFASGVSYKGQSGGDKNSIQLRTKNNNSGIVITANANNLDVQKIKVTWDGDTANTRTIDVYGKDTPYEATTDLYSDDAEVQGTLIGSLVLTDNTDPEKLVQELEISDSYKYIGLRSHDQAQYVLSLDITWGVPQTFEYSNVYLRFSGLISTSLWNRLEEESDIKGYGIMIASKDYLNSIEAEDSALETLTPDGTNVKRYYTELTETKTHPALASETQKQGLTGDYYVWNLKKSIADDALTDEFVAVAFIVIDGETLFFGNIRSSAKSVAKQLLDDKIYAADEDDGALYNLAHLND